MSAVVCPTCGAGEGMNCSTVRGNDHRKRMLAEIAELEPRVSAVPVKQERATDG